MKTSYRFIRNLIAQHSGNLERQYTKFDPDTIRGKLAEVDDIARRFSERCEAIERDERFTDEGRRTEKQTAGQNALKALEAWFRPLKDGLDKHEQVLVEELREKFQKPKAADTTERVERAIRYSEIRATVRGLNALERQALYREATPDMRAAFDEAPVVQIKNGTAQVTPFVDDETRSEVLLADAREQAPDTAAVLSDIGTSRELYEIIQGNVDKLVTDVVGKPAAEPVIVGQ